MSDPMLVPSDISLWIRELEEQASRIRRMRRGTVEERVLVSGEYIEAALELRRLARAAA